MANHGHCGAGTARQLSETPLCAHAQPVGGADAGHRGRRQCKSRPAGSILTIRKIAIIRSEEPLFVIPIKELGVRPRADVAAMAPYVPGRPAEEVKAQFGLDQVVKLASNENPFGPSPRAVE